MPTPEQNPPRQLRLTSGEDPLFNDLLPHDGKPLDFSVLQPCDILLEPSHDLYGAVAKAFGQDYQHAIVVADDVRYGWEGVGDGVHRNRISTTKPYQVWRLREDVPPEILNAILASALEDNGQPYGYLELIASGVRIAGQSVDLGPNEIDKPQVCSGYVHRWFREAGLTLCPGKPDFLVYPEDIALSALLYRVA